MTLELYHCTLSRHYLTIDLAADMTTALMNLHRWITKLGLARQSPPSWYRNRLREELQERRAAVTAWHKLSESSDVLFSILRAHHDGHPIVMPPPFRIWHNSLTYGYMVAKYTSRWNFYRMATRFYSDVDYQIICEVVNPAKDHKLEEVALRHHINPLTFKKTCRRLRRVWPLLP